MHSAHRFSAARRFSVECRQAIFLLKGDSLSGASEP